MRTRLCIGCCTLLVASLFACQLERHYLLSVFHNGDNAVMHQILNALALGLRYEHRWDSDHIPILAAFPSSKTALFFLKVLGCKWEIQCCAEKKIMYIYIYMLCVYGELKYNALSLSISRRNSNTFPHLIDATNQTTIGHVTIALPIINNHKCYCPYGLRYFCFLNQWHYSSIHKSN